MRNPIRLFLADSQPIVRKGLAQIVVQIPGVVVCGESADGTQALQSILRTQPDIVILDLQIGGMNGLTLIRRLKIALPKTRILVFSPLEAKRHARKALVHGADGWVWKEAPPEKLIEGLQKLLERRRDGDGFIGDLRRVRSSPLRESGDYRASPLDRLSDRELEVFRLIGRGRGTSQIAQELRLSAKTIETYREHIKIKLHLADAGALREHAIHWARQDPPEPRGNRGRSPTPL